MRGPFLTLAPNSLEPRLDNRREAEVLLRSRGISVSTEIHHVGLSSSLPAALHLTMEFDRVLLTAADRPSVDSLPALPDPAADHEDAGRKQRREDVEEKHQRIRDFLDATGHDAVVLGLADSAAWFTSGGDLGQDLSG